MRKLSRFNLTLCLIGSLLPFFASMTFPIAGRAQGTEDGRSHPIVTVDANVDLIRSSPFRSIDAGTVSEQIRTYCQVEHGGRR